MRYSQYEEEAIIREFFGDHVGTFLDLGAADGLKNSNTRALALRGWTGWCVEPNPYLFNELFKLYRMHPAIRLVHAALSQSGDVLKFYNAEQLSTASEETVHLENMRPLFTGSYLIPSITPSKLAKLVNTQFDFINLDCEAMDLEIAGSAKMLFEGARLLCYEHTLPGVPTDAIYTAKWQAMLDFHGFTKVIGRTEGNVLVAR